MSQAPDENRPLTEDQIVIATELHVLSEAPKAAKLVLHTLGGNEAFGITDEIAAGLIEMLELFLERKPS